MCAAGLSRVYAPYTVPSSLLKRAHILCWWYCVHRVIIEVDFLLLINNAKAGWFCYIVIIVQLIPQSTWSLSTYMYIRVIGKIRKINHVSEMSSYNIGMPGLQ